MIDADIHSARSTEARRRIAIAASLDEFAATRSDGDAAVILAGARAFLWIASGIRREASERLIDALYCVYGPAPVLSVAITMCKEQPPGARTWLRQVCKYRAGDAATLPP